MPETDLSRWFRPRHRRWEDVLAVALGALIVLSPVLATSHPSSAVILSAGVAGIIIIAAAILEFQLAQRWKEGIQLACGAWIVASPLVLGYGGATRNWHFVLGGAVAILAGFELLQRR